VETLKRSLQLKQKGPSTHASVLREVVRRPAWSAGYGASDGLTRLPGKVRLRKEMGESGVRLKSVEHENKLLRVAFQARGCVGVALLARLTRSARIQTRLKDLSGERDALKNLHERNADAATQLAIEVAGLKVLRPPAFCRLDPRRPAPPRLA